MTAPLRYTVFLLVSVLNLGCDNATSPAQPDFGAHYRVLLDPQPPVLTTDTLTLTVAYGACGPSREFALEHRTLGDGQVEVWARKVTPDEPCDMLVTERRAFAVDAAVRDAAVVVLIAPSSSPYQLRP